MTHPHDTPPTPDAPALASVLTPEELLNLKLMRAADEYDRWPVLIQCIERLAGEVARLRAEPTGPGECFHLNCHTDAAGIATCDECGATCKVSRTSCGGIERETEWVKGEVST